MNSIVLLNRPQSPHDSRKLLVAELIVGFAGKPQNALAENVLLNFVRAATSRGRCPGPVDDRNLGRLTLSPKKQISEFSRRVLVHDELLYSTLLRLVIVGVCVPDQKSWRGLSYPLS